MKKALTILLLIIIIIFAFNQIRKHASQPSHSMREALDTAGQRKIMYYTCGMHPGVKVDPKEYEKGNTQCPICNMALIPVYSEEKTSDTIKERQISVSLRPQEISRAGIKTFTVRFVPLVKEIRTVGIVAYDPGLRAAEEEYIQALITHEKISQSAFNGAQKRAKEILDAAEIKLERLGLTEEWIKELEENRVVHRNLILPDAFMWVYADIYEYEALWPEIGDTVEITASIKPSVVFEGEIKGIEPVIYEKARTMKLKILVENEDYLLKPNMYVDVYTKSDLGRILSIPKSAVLDTGKRKIVYVGLGDGKFQLREVVIGPSAQGLVDGKKIDFYPLVEGIKEGEEVVVKGNFLINSQSQLGTAAAAYGGALTPSDTMGEETPSYLHTTH